jgi:hypothetical protein
MLLIGLVNLERGRHCKQSLETTKLRKEQRSVLSFCLLGFSPNIRWWSSSLAYSPLKCHVAFKITIESKFSNDHRKFNGDFKSHVIFERTQ